jgi:DNA end-binding protein Ku
MPRAIWSGTITFGLIAIPVKLYPAIGRTDKVDMHLLHEKDGERIHYERRCEAGHKVDWDDVVRGYEYAKGKWVTFTDEELDAIRTESMHTVDVVTFVPAEQIDPMYYENTYYVAAESTGAKAYRLLVDALENEGLVGISKVAIRDRERLAAIRVNEDGVIVLNTMHWPDEIRDASTAKTDGRAAIRDNERKMARQLVRQLSGDFTPDEFEDEYHKALKAAVRRKVQGKDVVVPEGREEAPAVADLMEALKRSVEAVRAGKDPRELRKAASKDVSKDDLERLSKDDLQELAADLEIPGRSKMDKRKLVRAIEKARTKAA